MASLPPPLPIPIPIPTPITPPPIYKEWAVVVTESGRIVWVGWTTEEATYQANKDTVPPGCEFVDLSTDLPREHVGRFMAYDPDRREFFYDKEKVEASGLMLAEVKVLLTQKPADVRASHAWETWPKTKPIRAT